MSDEEGFLHRWSRRKRATAATEDAPDAAAAAPPADAAASAETPPLPPVDSIEAGSDIRAFLAPGVPSALSQAALRRAWSADPAIRDFIGLSENAWDFTAADGVPGFGAIDPDSVERLLGRVMGTAETSETAVTETEAETGDMPQEPAGPQQSTALAPTEDTAPPADESAASPEPLNKVNAAARDDTGKGETSLVAAPRRHGGALPD